MVGKVEVKCPVVECDYRTGVLLGIGQDPEAGPDATNLDEQELWLRLEHPHHPGSTD